MPLPRSFSSIAAVLLSVIIVTCAAQVASAQAQPAVVPAVSSTLAEAFALYQGGKFASAAEKYRLVLDTDDKNSDAYAGLVEALLKQKFASHSVKLNTEKAQSAVPSATGSTSLTPIILRPALILVSPN